MVFLWGGVLGVVSAILVETARITAGRNFHGVVPGLAYRSAQPTPEDLQAMVRDYGIRTVVNLRGQCAPAAWFLEEARATHRLGLSQEDLCFSSYRLPADHELRRLLKVFDHSERPLLIHCRRGADRTGLASAVYLLSQCEVSLAEARRQMSWRYGHLGFGGTRHLSLFFDLYEEWLQARDIEHSRSAFRQWTEGGYNPGGCRALLEPLDFPHIVPPGTPLALRVRARNIGVRPWLLKPERNVGVHLGYMVLDRENRVVVHDRSGLFHAEVSPGQALELTVVVPALHAPGRYQLWIDMVDEQHCWFYQTGSEPLEWDLEVR